MTDDALFLDRQLCFALHATSRAVTQAYAPLLEPLGVTYPQYLVMLVLWEEDDLTVGGIGERLYLDSGTLTPLLKRLEAQGIVLRSRDLVDERAVRISLTAKGKKLRAKAAGIREGVACAIGVEEETITSLRDSLRDILARMRAPAPSRQSPQNRKQRSR